MVVAYAMVKANTGEANRLRRDIDDVDGVVSAHIVAGDVDIIAKLDVADPESVKQVVAEEIQRIDGVETTETYIAME
ncbi:MAG: Lrp/AsnC family transcriptional regulator [Halobacteriaceae archaeon]